MTRTDKYHQAVRRIAPGFWGAGRSLTGKIYLPVQPATNPEERAVAASADPSDSKQLPATGATPGADQLPTVIKEEIRNS